MKLTTKRLQNSIKCEFYLQVLKLDLNFLFAADLILSEIYIFLLFAVFISDLFIDIWFMYLIPN